MDKDRKVGLVKSKNHILILTPGFPSDENDFLSIPPLQEFLIKFKSSFPLSKFTVISLHYPYQEKKYFWNGISVISLAGRNNALTKPFLWYKSINSAQKINESESVDLIHSLWLGECALIGNFLSNKFKCSHICTLMGQDVKKSNKYFRFLKINKIKIVALSKNQSDQFNKLTNKNVDEVIYWGIDNQPDNNVERDIDLLAVGSLIPLKNYTMLIRLVEEIMAINNEINCVLVGSGTEESKLKRIAAEKGVENNIKLTGLLSRTEIFKLMQRSKIFIHPSMFEGSGFVFAEALVNGMNIVSFNVGYAQSNPKWFIAKDEEDFINITKNLLTSKLDFNKINQFPITETINKYAKLYGMQ